MAFRDNVKCKGCGSVVKRKRFGQRYCSKKCSSAASVHRFRLRSAYAEAALEPQNKGQLPPYREVLTPDLQAIDLKGISSPVLDTHTRLLRRPIINVSRKPVSRGLLAFIVQMEAAPEILRGRLSEAAVPGKAVL